MTHENNNIDGPSENLSSDERKVAEMLGGLKRVEAPKDFDFHLKARIANGRPSQIRSASFLPILKYAIPLGLILLVGSVVFIYNSYDPLLETAMVPAPESADKPLPVTRLDEPENTVAAVKEPASEPAPRGVEQRDVPVETTDRVPQQIASKKNRVDGGSVDFRLSGAVEPSGGSTDRALNPAPTPRTPTGMQLNPLGVGEALKLIGADAGFENGSWVIKSVAAGGVAARMGMKAGDLLKAIDGSQVMEKTLFPSKFGAKTIKVQRGDKILDLSLAGERKP